MTKDLTEAWKKGELETGLYYYIKVNGKTIPSRLSKYGNFYLTEGACGCNAMRKVEEVLAEVPSYEEWQDLELEAYKEGWGDGYEMTIQKTKKQCREFYKKKYEKKIHKLKELLKECRKTLNKAKGDTVWYPVEIDHLLTKIDEVLNANVR